MDSEAAIRVELKNYRPFPDARPAKITVQPGMTALVGVNNAGKSALLRFFYESRNLFAVIQAGSSAMDAALKQQPQSFGYPREVPDPADVFNNQNTRALQIKLEITGTFDGTTRRMTEAQEAREIIATVDRDTANFRLSLFVASSQVFPTGFVNDGYHLSTPQGIVSIADLVEASRILRNTLYIGPFRSAINVGTQNEYYDIQIGQSFIQQWRRLLTGPRKSENEATLKLMQNIQRTFEFTSFSINASQDEQTLQFFVNDRSYRLNELGAGLAQFVVSASTAAVRHPSLILIDEPELNLHPRLQLEFLTMLAGHAEIGVMFATHVIGLARAGADHVYSVRRIADGDSEVRPLEGTPQLLELLGELGFSAYRDLGVYEHSASGRPD